MYNAYHKKEDERLLLTPEMIFSHQKKKAVEDLPMSLGGVGIFRSHLDRRHRGHLRSPWRRGSHLLSFARHRSHPGRRLVYQLFLHPSMDPNRVFRLLRLGQKVPHGCGHPGTGLRGRIRKAPLLLLQAFLGTGKRKLGIQRTANHRHCLLLCKERQSHLPPYHYPRRGF